jgi:amino acid transporter
MNIRGVRIVGKASIIFTVFLLSPFVGQFNLITHHNIPSSISFFIFNTDYSFDCYISALMIIGIVGLKPANWLLLSSTDIKIWNSKWGLFLTVIAWNTSGFDNVSSVAGEMENPKKSYLKAMLISLAITMFFYIGPLAVGVSYDTQFEKWTDGYWSEIAAKVFHAYKQNKSEANKKYAFHCLFVCLFKSEQILFLLIMYSDWNLYQVGGYPLKVWTVLGGCVSSLGMLNAYLLTTSQALVAWAEPQMLGSINFIASHISKTNHFLLYLI